MGRSLDISARIAPNLVAPVTAHFIPMGNPPVDVGTLGFALTRGASLSLVYTFTTGSADHKNDTNLHLDDTRYPHQSIDAARQHCAAVYRI